MPRNTATNPFVHQIRGTSIRVVVAILGAMLLAWCMMATGHSGAEDEAFPKAQMPPDDAIAVPGIAEPIQTGQVPAEVIDAIEELLHKQAFNGTIIEHHGEDDVEFDYAYRCERYRTHTSDRLVTYPKPSWAILGPTQDGFRFTLEWFDAKRVKRIMFPATLIGYNGHINPYQFWNRYDNYYKLPNNSGFVALQWNMGKRSDRKIFADVRSTLEAFGPPVFKDAPDLWMDWVDTAEELEPQLIQQLTETVGKLQPEAKWRRYGQSHFCEYKTHEFDIHHVSEDGVVAADAHREVGPLTGGFIIRLTPDGDFYDDSGQRVKPIYGRTAGPYWYHYYATYGGGFGRCRLDIMYGVGVDKKVLEEVTAALEKSNGPPERF